MRKLFLGLAIVFLIVTVPGCATGKKVMKNCEPTTSGKNWVCEEA